MLWLAAYLTGFPPVGLHTLRWTHGLAPMWSGLYLISTRVNSRKVTRFDECQCPLGLIPHFYLVSELVLPQHHDQVSMPSRAYTSFLQADKVAKYVVEIFDGVNALSGLYLIST